MTALLYTRDDDEWEPVQELHVRSGGVWRKVLEAWVRDAGTWKRFHLALTATPNTSSIVGTRSGAGSVTSGVVTVAAAGGSGSYTFLWSIVSQSGPVTASLTSSSAATTAMQCTFTDGGQLVQGQIKCTVTDTVTGLQVDSANVSFTLASL